MRDTRALAVAALLLVAPVPVLAQDHEDAAVAPGERQPEPFEEEAAPLPPIELGWRGFTHGAKPGDTLGFSVVTWFAELKETSDFSFGHHSDGDPKFVKDLGASRSQRVHGANVGISLGRWGWFSGECLILDLARQRGYLHEPYTVDHVELDRGDVVLSDTRMILGSLTYGHELRYRFIVAEELTIDAFFSPTLGLGVWDLDVALRRVGPAPTGRLGGHTRAWIIVPGFRAGVDLLDTLRLGVDLEWLPGVTGGCSFFRPVVQEWERLRLHAGLRLGPLEVTVGWRHLNSSLREPETRPDLKLRGFDFTLGLRF